MRMRTFTGLNMKDAVRQVRLALGESALILSERITKTGVEVVAAADHGIGADNACHDDTVPTHAEAAPSHSSRSAADDMISSDSSATSPDPESLRDLLLWHRLPEVLADELLTAPLAAALSRLVTTEAFSFSAGQKPLALVGPAGSGKTLSVAKLATRLMLAGNTPLVITTDRDKDGGIEQLAAHTRRLGIPLIAAHNDDTLKRALQERQQGQPVLIDTPAINPYTFDTHAILTELVTLTQATLCLTLPAGHDTEETADIAEIFSKAQTRLMIATKFDQARRIGNIVTAAACGLSLTEAGVSDAAAGGLARLTPRLLAARLLSRSDPPVMKEESGENIKPTKTRLATRTSASLSLLPDDSDEFPSEREALLDTLSPHAQAALKGEHHV